MYAIVPKEEPRILLPVMRDFHGGRTVRATVILKRQAWTNKNSGNLLRSRILLGSGQMAAGRRAVPFVRGNSGNGKERGGLASRGTCNTCLLAASFPEQSRTRLFVRSVPPTWRLCASVRVAHRRASWVYTWPFGAYVCTTSGGNTTCCRLESMPRCTRRRQRAACALRETCI